MIAVLCEPIAGALELVFGEERRPGEDLLAGLIPRRATADTLGLDSGSVSLRLSQKVTPPRMSRPIRNAQTREMPSLASVIDAVITAATRVQLAP